jgi:hypothetical protein
MSPAQLRSIVRGEGKSIPASPGASSAPPVGAENLRHQVIFVKHASSAIAPLDPELIQIRDAVGQLP